jgi:hypothetical protein
MRFARIVSDGREGIALAEGDSARALFHTDAMGTTPGVGLERDPQLFMKAGDLCVVEIEGIGLLGNPIVDEALPVSSQQDPRRHRHPTPPPPPGPPRPLTSPAQPAALCLIAAAILAAYGLRHNRRPGLDAAGGKPASPGDPDNPSIVARPHHTFVTRPDGGHSHVDH